LPGIEGPMSTSFDEVTCEKPGDGCEWPECECCRKDTFVSQPASPLPEPDWKATAERANAAASRVIEDARVGPETKRIPMGPASPLREVSDERAFNLSQRIHVKKLTVEEGAIEIMHYATDAIEAECQHTAAAFPLLGREIIEQCAQIAEGPLLPDCNGRFRGRKGANWEAKPMRHTYGAGRLDAAAEIRSSASPPEQPATPNKDPSK